MRNKTAIRALCAALSLLMLLPTLSACRSKAPDISEVSVIFESLIEASYEINDIFYGPGLKTYPREYSVVDQGFDRQNNVHYWIISDPELGRVLKYYSETEKEHIYMQELSAPKEGEEPDHITNGKYYYLLTEYDDKSDQSVYDAESPRNYDFVLLTEKYQSSEQIKDAADRVYTEKYLEGVYTMIFDGYMDEEIGMVYPRYMTAEVGEDNFFWKSNAFKPYFEVQTKYDYSSMKIVEPSRADYVNVEIRAYGICINYEDLTYSTDWYTKTLKFEKNDAGEWRLATPTY